jgi:hypothetical protein
MCYVANLLCSELVKERRRASPYAINPALDVPATASRVCGSELEGIVLGLFERDSLFGASERV